MKYRFVGGPWHNQVRAIPKTRKKILAAGLTKPAPVDISAPLTPVDYREFVYIKRKVHARGVVSFEYLLSGQADWQATGGNGRIDPVDWERSTPGQRRFEVSSFECIYRLATARRNGGAPFF